MLVLRHLTERAVDVAHEGDDVCFLHGQSQLVVVHLAERQQLVDEAQQAVDALLHRADGLLHIARQLAVGLYALHGAADDGERRAELMRDIGEELHLILRQLFLHPDAVAQVVDTAEVAVERPADDGDDTYIYKVCPPSGPERRADDDDLADGVLVPLAVGVERAHLHGVTARRQVLVGGEVDVRQRRPVTVVALQAVAVFRALFLGVLEVGEVERQRVLVVAEAELLLLGQPC